MLAIFLQARMGSSRLPNKVMKPLLGKPMIARIIERLQKINNAQKIILLTGNSTREAALTDYVKSLNIDFFCGSELDVLDRFYQCAKLYEVKQIVRATGDNPFVDIAEGERLIDLHLSSGADYSCAFSMFGCNLPIGTGLEIFTFDALESSWEKGKALHHREHVNEYILENATLFKIKSLAGIPVEKESPQLKLTVDTPEDFAKAESIYKAFYTVHSQNELVDIAWVIKHFRE